MGICRIELKLVSQPSPELLECNFHCSRNPRPIISVRGKTSGAAQDCGTFQWTAAVRALITLFIRTAAYPDPLVNSAVISGDAGSLAAALDNSLYKQPGWLCEMFGIDADGNTLLRRILNRTNPGRKRAGAVIISVNRNYLSASDIQVICDGELVNDPAILETLASAMELEAGTVGIERKQGLDKAKQSLHQTLEKITVDNTDALKIDVKFYLKLLREQIAILSGSGINDNKIINHLKNQIKQVCILSEQFHTQRVAENFPNSRFLYSCSSLTDTGLSSYLKDDGWLMLLRIMGQSKRMHGGSFERIFFIDPQKLSIQDLKMLASIISLHLENSVNVRLMDPGAVPAELISKRNMAWMGGKVLLHATDQISWDLDITSQKSRISFSKDQHAYFQDNSIETFSSGDNASIMARLGSLSQIEDQAGRQKLN